MTRAGIFALVGLAVYLPFEDFVLKWIPVSGQLYLLLTQVPDLLVFTVAAVALGWRHSSEGQVRRLGNGADLALGAFIALALFTTVIRAADPIVVGLNLKALLRYVLVAYAFVNLPVRDRHRRLFLVAITFAVCVQAAIGFAELLGGSQVRSFFLPAAPEAEVSGVQLKFTAPRESAKGWIFGTMGNTIGFGMFIIVGLSVWLTKQEEGSRVLWAGTLILLFLAYFSGSRSVFLTGLLIIGGREILRGRTRRVLVGLVAGGILVAVYVAVGDGGLPTNYIVSAFTGEYIDIAFAQRLGIVAFVLPRFLIAGPVTLLFGLTPDRALLDRFVVGLDEVPVILKSNIATMEDVYWVALLFYYGLLGVLALATFLYALCNRLSRIRRHEFNVHRVRLAEGAILLLVAMIPLNMFNQAFEVRTISFYLWALVGIALSLPSYVQKNGDEERPVSVQGTTTP